VTVKIRGMLLSDKPHIVKIVEETKAFLPEEVKIAEELIDEYFNDPDGCGYYFYVAEDEGRVAGYLCYGPTPMTQGTWDMYWAAVSPDLMGKGIGSTLFKLAEKDISHRGGRMILIETSSNPHYGAARSLYHTLGYHLVSTIPDFYSPGDNKEIFRKVL
jgi:ribosomal protein S18 acetylase RimI-like enzyme